MDEISVEIITSIAIMIVLGIAYAFFSFLKEREEKKMTYGSEFVVRTTKGVVLFFLIWMIICVSAIIGVIFLLLAYEEPNEVRMFWILESICFAFFLLGALGFVISKFNYYVVKQDGILIKQIFKKDKLIKYSDITYINNNVYGFGQVTCYDGDGVVILSVDHMHVGVEKLDSFLRERGYKIIPNPYPSEEMKKSKRYQQYQKLSSLKVGFWCFVIFGILSLGMGIMVSSLVSFTEFENYKISGVVENFEIGEESLTIYLKNDENIYYINNIVYDKLDKNLYTILENGVTVKLYIAGINSYGKSEISQLEISGTIYLDMNSARDAEYSNYLAGKITSYVFIGIGGVLLVLGLVWFLRLDKFKKTNMLIKSNDVK